MASRDYDVIVLGATGYTGRQVVRALVHRGASQSMTWAVAGRNPEKLQSLVSDLVPQAVPQPALLIADCGDPDSLQRMAAQTAVVLNLAGPYATRGDAVVQACIANGTHHLDLSGETFWVQRLVQQHHRSAQDAAVKIITCCGYEALPFDLATLWAATQLRERTGEACKQVKIVVSFTGKRIKNLRDAVSGGTVASLQSLLAHDRTDCVRNPACLLPPDAVDVAAVAKRNAYRFLPQFDEDVRSVTAPTLPAPFVNPPIVLRTQALLADESLYAPEFRYSESLSMKSLVPSVPLLPEGSTLPLQWAAAAALAAPLANLSAALSGPLGFERAPIAKLVEWLAPHVGQGPGEAALSSMGYAFDVFATSVSGRALHGRMEAQGHPGYRSAPEMVATAAVGLARGTLGNTPHFGVVTPSSGLGIEAVGAMREAGVVFSVVA